MPILFVLFFQFPSFLFLLSDPIVGFADPEFTNNESDGDLEACLVLSGASPLTTFTAVVNPIPVAVPNAAIPDGRCEGVTV